MRIVLDTATFITAIRSSGGAAAEVVRLCLLGDFVLLMDLKLGLEYRDVALRPFQLASTTHSPSMVLELIERLEAAAEAVEIRRKMRPLSSDPNDDMVLDVAINGLADAVVTANRRHFLEVGTRFGFDIVSPAELLTRYRKGDKYANRIS